MKHNFLIVLLFAFFAIAVCGQTPKQTPPLKPPAPKPDKKTADYSKEPTVAEQIRTAYRFENDAHPRTLRRLP